MPACWEVRGCDSEMQSRCPHNVDGQPCPADCLFTYCARPSRELANPLDALANPSVDRSVCRKETCLLCTFFIANGPKVTASL